MSYLWFKAAHLLAVITWMSGSSYIFRLFGFHVERRASADASALLVVMERRLLRIVMLPGALATVGLGLTMLTVHPELMHERWMQLKLGSVAVMLLYDGYAHWVATRFARGDYVLTAPQCRWLHSVPTTLLLVIVAMVIVRPF
ncbi:MAG: CopD family protein [Gemmatimonadetes bacterium]|nr:CopD family protein [Gemmatimonadota bacterium]